MLGQDRLVARLIPGSDLNLKDAKYSSPPLGWAIHGWCNPPAGNNGRQLEVVALLVSAVATVGLEDERVRADPMMLGTGHARVARAMFLHPTSDILITH